MRTVSAAADQGDPDTVCSSRCRTSDDGAPRARRCGCCNPLYPDPYFVAHTQSYFDRGGIRNEDEDHCSSSSSLSLTDESSLISPALGRAAATKVAVVWVAARVAAARVAEALAAAVRAAVGREAAR